MLIWSLYIMHILGYHAVSHKHIKLTCQLKGNDITLPLCWKKERKRRKGKEKRKQKEKKEIT